MSCPCDEKAIFTPLDIPAGMDSLPRQMAGFPDFRRAMLTALREKYALNNWQARDEDDLGVMLLEMWAYVCDVLSFYDEVIANENYLRTAELRPSLRKLTDLLGYVPRPAVASSVVMTAIAEGRKALNLNQGTAFRSEAFDEESPQVFELDSDTSIHPLNNSWKVDPQRPTTLSGTHTTLLLQDEHKKLQKNDVFIAIASSTSVHQVDKREAIVGNDEESYTRLTIDPGLSLSLATSPDDITLSTPAQTAGLWTIGTSPQAVMSSYTELVLNGLYRQLQAGQKVLVSKGGEYRWFSLIKVADTMMNITTGGNYTVDEEDVTVDPVIAPATKLTLDTSLNNASRKGAGSDWTNSHASELQVHYAFIKVGDLTLQRQMVIDENSVLKVKPNSGKNIQQPVDASSPNSFVLKDVNQVSVQGNGTLNYSTGELTFQGYHWDDSLTPAIKVLGNVMNATRGETVTSEILGSGDATQALQTFTLKKSPLTYIAAPTSDDERGVSSTLTVWVDGIQWEEVASFYGHEENDEVYIVRQNDDQESLITFGDGIRGRRLPSGVDNVVASYRYGAGAVAPLANTITQLARPVKGLSSVINPFAATGGSDEEDAEGIRGYAPQSALLLGRAISVPDFIAAASGLAGVKAAQAQWRWNNQRQRPVVQIWYIGTSSTTTVSTALRNLADPSISLDVEKSVPQALSLSFDVEVDSTYVDTQVLATLRHILTDESDGMLSEKHIGIGGPLYRSQLFEAILAIPGTISVTDMRHDGTAFDEMGIKPTNPGFYFTVDSSVAAGAKLIINGEE
jgi:hypothetical protein